MVVARNLNKEEMATTRHARVHDQGRLLERQSSLISCD